jgi:hypothetical protein
MTRSQLRHSKRSMSRPPGAVRLASIATPHMGQCFGRGGRDVFKLDPMLQASPLVVEAGIKDQTVEFALAVRSLIQIKTPRPASDSEPSVARISRRRFFRRRRAGFLPRNSAQPGSPGPARSCGNAKLDGILHLAVSRGAQPFRRVGASLLAPRAC